MTSNTLIVFFAVIIELLIFVTLADLVWRIISIRRSYIPLPVQREINKTTVCSCPDSLWIYLKLIFFNPKDMHFLRHDDIKAITIAEQDKISWILLIVCLLLGPPVGILCMLLFYKSKPRSAHIYLFASFVFLVIALVIHLLNTLI